MSPPGGRKLAMNERNGHGPGSARKPAEPDQPDVLGSKTAGDAYQIWADADQSSSDADQTSADADQTASDSDDVAAVRDQRASDRDQATADRDHDAESSPTAEEEQAYDTSRGERETTTIERLGNRLGRATTTADRIETQRDVEVTPLITDSCTKRFGDRARGEQ